MNSRLRLGIVILAGVLIVALAVSVALAGDDAPTDQTGRNESMVDLLEDNGLVVEPQGPVDGALFEVPTESFVVNGDLVLTYRFDSVEDARAAAGRLQPDGSGIDTVRVGWIAPPHFFQAGDIFVLHLGEQTQIQDALPEQYGEQIAGAR